jgi:hypothetical protein
MGCSILRAARGLSLQQPEVKETASRKQKSPLEAGLPLNDDSLCWRRENPNMTEFKTACKARLASEFLLPGSRRDPAFLAVFYPPLPPATSPTHCLVPILEARF